MTRSRKTMAIILIGGLVVTGLSGALISCQKPRNETQVPSQKQIYQCPMHPNYLSDKPGNCPICGMTLVLVKEGQHQPAIKKTGDRKILYYRDAMNPSHTSDKPGKAPDGMDLVPVYEDEARGEAGEVKIDPTTVQNMGVTTETVTARDLTKEIRVSGTIDLNETAISIVNTKIMGWVEKLFIDYTGQKVKKGQPLLTIYSPDLVSAQEEYVQAIHYLQNLPQGITPDARKGAEQLVESGKRRLLNWDIPDRSIAALEKRNVPEKAMTIYSPSNGVVLDKMVVAGQNVMPGMALYKVADLSVVWAMANVYQEDLPYVKLGTEATVEVTSITGRTFRGKVQFVSPVLDPSTKTAAVRIAIRNTADLLLKPQMFANITIQSPVLRNVLSVSQQAVIHTGERNIIIVSLGNGYFKPQEVKLGMSANGFVQVLTGLIGGQTIVTSSQFLIDSESNLKKAVSQMSGIDSTMPMPEQPQNTAKEEKKQAPQENQKMNMPGM
jgi:Cu(I)/Ag(I) efflux system membrane fusion protein/cobalt-zinc-cadmium efflux system membrane fusion protein